MRRNRRNRRAGNRNIATAVEVFASRPKHNKRPAAAPQNERVTQQSPGRRMNYDDFKVISGFQNKAGQYELTRVADGQVHYSFKNRDGKTVDSIMPLVTWQNIAARATHG
jgi:hypothetical protein